MPTRHLGSLAKNSSTRLRDNFCRKATCPAASTPCTRKTDFAISNPIVVTCFIVVLLSTHPQIMLREGRESRPHHQKKTFVADNRTSRLHINWSLQVAVWLMRLGGKRRAAAPVLAVPWTYPSSRGGSFSGQVGFYSGRGGALLSWIQIPFG